ncbi:MAG: hypothetical protein GF308_04075 [Candidatus Heimdallarchaeota archaeon]|nr:hypothetical protein [Candidatus Heimdallarchaeota archaeon]
MVNSEKQGPKTNYERSTAYVMSVYLLIAGVVLLTLLVGLVPGTMPYIYEGSGDPEQIYSNWFYHVEYNYPFGSTTHQLDRMEPNLGFYLLMPVVMTLLGLSGGTVLLTDCQETKQLIFLSWASYLLPAIIGIVKLIQIYPTHFWSTFQGGESFTWPLGFYPLYAHLFLQLALVLNQQSFKDWAVFSLKKKGTSRSRLAQFLRLLSTIIFLLIYVCAWAGPPVILMISSSITLLLLYFTVFLAVGLFLLWFMISELVPKMVSLVKKAIIIITESKNITDS